MRRFLLWLCICALVIRLLTLGGALLWYDEAFTATIARLPLLDMLAAVRGDVHPPLWYLIEWVIAHTAGTGALAMRLPAALFGTGAVAETYNLVKRIGGETPARWAGIAMAVMPGQIYYSQEARMYSLLTLLVLLGMRAVMDRNWLRLGLVLPAILYTQTIGIVYVAILAGWALLSGRRAALARLAVGGLTYLPWAAVAVGQAARVGGSFWLPLRPSLGAPFYFVSFTTIFARLPHELYIHGIAASLIVTGAALVGLWHSYKRYALLLLMTFGPPAILYILSFVWRPVLLDRSLLPAGAALVGLWGAGLSRLGSWSRRALAFVVAPILLMAFVTYFTDPTNQRPRTDPITQTIITGWQDGDAMYHITLESKIAYDYYLPDHPSFVLPEAGDLAQSLTDPTKQAMGLTADERLFSALGWSGYRRAWLFVVTNPVTSTYEIRQANYILEHWTTIQEWRFLDNEMSQFRLCLIDLSHSTGG
jgi:mannosyltransferase